MTSEEQKQVIMKGGSELLEKMIDFFESAFKEKNLPHLKIREAINAYMSVMIEEWGKMHNRETVICAAVRTEDGQVIRGHRHGHAMVVARDMKLQLEEGPGQQGFITSRNRYVTREEGRKLQDAAGIPSADPGGYRGTTLFSEDLY